MFKEWYMVQIEVPHIVLIFEYTESYGKTCQINSLRKTVAIGLFLLLDLLNFSLTHEGIIDYT